MAPQLVSSTPDTPLKEDDEVSRRMMARRVKVIAELLQTEKDYISDLDLCIKEVIQPLRNKQVSAGCGGGGGDAKVSTQPCSACGQSPCKHKCRHKSDVVLGVGLEPVLWNLLCQGSGEESGRSDMLLTTCAALG